MALRYSDSGSSAHKDFVKRDRKPSLLELALVFMVVILLCVSLPSMVLNKTYLVLWLTGLLAAFGWYVLLEVLRNRDMVLATEYQNALFASALGFNNKFCLIIKREGNIVYMDNGFQKVFPDLIKERNISVTALLKHGKVDTIDREKIFAAIDRGVYDKLIFEIRSSGGENMKIVMSLEPIIRPSGFILLRARDFVEQRNRENSPEPRFQSLTNPLLTKSSITLFAYIMDRMNTGVYMTDPAGTIIYANPLVEQWLAFRETEIVSKNLSLKDLVHQGSSDPGAISPGNFEGEVTLQKKEGGLIRAFINQKVILDDDKKVLGCVALINNIVERDPTLKKTLW